MIYGQAVRSVVKAAEGIFQRFLVDHGPWMRGVEAIALELFPPMGGSAHERIEALAHLRARGFETLG